MARRVYYIDGSPFARIVRASLIEFEVPHEAVALRGYPPEGIAALSPALQVPVLEEEDGARYFDSELIRAFIHNVHARRIEGRLAPELTRAEHHWKDLQVLTAIRTLTEALVLYFHARWAGLGPVGENRLGCDMIGREMERAQALLDWLEAEAGQTGFREDGFSAPDLALAAALLWTEAREAVAWRGRARLEAIVARAATRESVRRTAPRPWPGAPLAMEGG